MIQDLDVWNPTKEQLMQCAKQCATVKEFRTLCPKAYRKAGRKKCRAECYRHLKKEQWTKHGAACGGEEAYPREYRSWRSVLSRVRDKKGGKHWPKYGARGITMPNSWDDYENFLKDIGEAPSMQHQIGRIDNDAPYSKENCRWETPKQQARNRRTTIWTHLWGTKYPLIEACEILNINSNLVKLARQRKGMTPEQALEYVLINNYGGRINESVL